MLTERTRPYSTGLVHSIHPTISPAVRPIPPEVQILPATVMRRIGYPSISTSVVGVNKLGPGSIIEPVAYRKSGECSNGKRMSLAFFQRIEENGQVEYVYIIC